MISTTIQCLACSVSWFLSQPVSHHVWFLKQDSNDEKAQLEISQVDLIAVSILYK